MDRKTDARYESHFRFNRNSCFRIYNNNGRYVGKIEIEQGVTKEDSDSYLEIAETAAKMIVEYLNR